MNNEIRQFIEEYRGDDDIFTTGGASQELISDAEKKLNIKFTDEYREYLSECGLLMAFGFELNGIGLNGSASFVEDTLRYRKVGLENHYVVVRNVDEFIECLNLNTGEISSWDSIDPTHKIIYDSFDEYILENLKEAKECWDEDENE